MKDEFVDYLGSIGVTTTAIKRITAIHNFYKLVCPEVITGIFVTDYIDEEGRREYENLWFFSDSLVMEAKGFLTGDDFDTASVRENVKYWQVKKQDYDFHQATAASRISIHLRLESGGLSAITVDLKASGNNCDYLRELHLKYFIPNMKVIKPTES